MKLKLNKIAFGKYESKIEDITYTIELNRYSYYKSYNITVTYPDGCYEEFDDEYIPNLKEAKLFIEDNLLGL
jgi:uncharacterized protein YneR